MQLVQSIFVRTSFIGFHAWPDAPEAVRYLSHRHRHAFNVEARVNVTHADRDVEYHMLQRELFAVICQFSLNEHGEAELGSMSCETIAVQIGSALKIRGYSVRSVQVDEDSENGSLVEGF